MNRVNFENHFDEAEKLILNAANDGLKEIEHLLKDRLRRVVRVKFNKITGTLLKSVQSRIKTSNKENKMIYVGVSRDAFYSLFLDKGTGVRKHKKTGKSVGQLKETRFIRQFYRENINDVKEVLIKYFKRI